MHSASTVRESGPAEINDAKLDLLLSAQFAVAWCGETGKEAGLGWWKGAITCEFGGWSLSMRMVANSLDWAAVQAVRDPTRWIHERGSSTTRAFSSSIRPLPLRLTALGWVGEAP